MKQYVTPSTEVVTAHVQPLLGNSIKNVSGIDGITVSDDDFVGGSADSRSGSIWDDE